MKQQKAHTTRKKSNPTSKKKKKNNKGVVPADHSDRSCDCKEVVIIVDPARRDLPSIDERSNDSGKSVEPTDIAGRQTREVRQIAERSPNGESEAPAARPLDLIIILLVIIVVKKLIELLLPPELTEQWGINLTPDDVLLLTEYFMIWTLQNRNSIFGSRKLVLTIILMTTVIVLTGS